MTVKILADSLPSTFLSALTADFDVLDIDNCPPAERTEIQGIVAYSHPFVDGPFMDQFPALRVVSNHGVGVDHIDVAAAVERGIKVGNTPGCLDDATADMTMALLLSFARNVVIGDEFARGPQFTHYDPALLIGREVTGSTLGIIGMGRIGTEVARRAAGFRMPVLYHNRNRRTDVEAELGVEFRGLDELLQTADFITLNCPLTADTTGLISTREFALMKPSAIVINMARGPVIDTNALLAALKSRRIHGAAVDGTDPEPLPRDHELLQMRNLIVTPHLGSATDNTRQRMMEMTIANLRAGIGGQSLPWDVAAN